jgi:hypothetical protein
MKTIILFITLSFFLIQCSVESKNDFIHAIANDYSRINDNLIITNQDSLICISMMNDSLIWKNPLNKKSHIPNYPDASKSIFHLSDQVVILNENFDLDFYSIQNGEFNFTIPNEKTRLKESKFSNIVHNSNFLFFSSQISNIDYAIISIEKNGDIDTISHLIDYSKKIYSDNELLYYQSYADINDILKGKSSYEIVLNYYNPVEKENKSIYTLSSDDEIWIYKNAAIIGDKTKRTYSKIDLISKKKEWETESIEPFSSLSLFNDDSVILFCTLDEGLIYLNSSQGAVDELKNIKKPRFIKKLKKDFIFIYSGLLTNNSKNIKNIEGNNTIRILNTDIKKIIGVEIFKENLYFITKNGIHKYWLTD